MMDPILTLPNASGRQMAAPLVVRLTQAAHCDCRHSRQKSTGLRQPQ